MSDAIIQVENLGKRYRISHQQTGGMRYKALRDVIADKIKGLIGNRESEIGNRKSLEDFWALRNVSFEVKRGEVVGIIGRNGAGKSTLLKILSRITEATEGRVILRGRVASLLEVGTGFHPELTGRENIFLNGAVLGMTKAEIKKKFDEIVAFAEVEKFLDTPVKRYSSGMYVRLAFAVAAHLEPEILIVDEVLAVGDAEFQKKCLGKMESVSRSEGRTVLFVSHNMQAIQQLTSRAIVLQDGKVAHYGNTEEGVRAYYSRITARQNSVYDVTNTPRRIHGTLTATLDRLWFPKDKTTFAFNEDIVFRAEVRAMKDLPSLCFSITVNSLDNLVVGSTFGKDTISLKSGEKADVEIRMTEPRLAPGKYYLVVGVSREGWLGTFVLYDVVFDVLHFEVTPPLNANGISGNWHQGWGDIIFCELETLKLSDVLQD